MTGIEVKIVTYNQVEHMGLRRGLSHHKFMRHMRNLISQEEKIFHSHRSLSSGPDSAENTSLKVHNTQQKAASRDDNSTGPATFPSTSSQPLSIKDFPPLPTHPSSACDDAQPSSASASVSCGSSAKSLEIKASLESVISKCDVSDQSSLDTTNCEGDTQLENSLIKCNASFLENSFRK